jgi:NAD(P)-dependent dehydrogenase (short-subunit alcohol dehydrogenase family)
MYAIACSALNASRSALPHLAASLCLIVNVDMAAAGRRRHGPYAASKPAYIALTEALAAEWKGKITVNAVLPSIIDTAANRASMPADFSKWVTPQELAEVVLFRKRCRQRGHWRAAPGERAGMSSGVRFFKTTLKRMRLPARAVASRPRLSA